MNLLPKRKLIFNFVSMNNIFHFIKKYVMVANQSKIICLKCSSGDIRPYQGEYFCNKCGLLFYLSEGKK